MSQIEELDALQRTLNHAIDTFRRELAAANLPPLSSQATEPHPLDDSTKLVPPRLYEARRLALGEFINCQSTREAYHSEHIFNSEHRKLRSILL